MTKILKKNRRDIILRKLPNGNLQSIPVFEISWGNPGKHVYIQSSIHGAEIQGNGVIAELLRKFSATEFNGKLTLVPYANPFSINNKMGTHTFGRFNPVTGENWNRSYAQLFKEERWNSFKKKIIDLSKVEIEKIFVQELRDELSEYSQSPYGISDNKLVAYELQKMAIEADIVLDLHCGPIATDYVYALEGQGARAKDLNIPFIIFAQPVFGGALDEAIFCPWYRLENLTQLDFEKEAYTVELRSEEVFDKGRVEEDVARLHYFFWKRGMVSEKPHIDLINISGSSVKNFKTYYAPESGQCHFYKKVGQKVKTGDLLFSIQVLNEDEEFFSIDVKSFADGVLINCCPTSNVVKGMEIFQILESLDQV